MTILDASALIGFLAGQPAAEQVAELLNARDTAIISVNLAETIDHLERVEGHSSREVLDPIDELIELGLSVLPVDQRDGRRAGELRASHYSRRTNPVALADCLLLASAIGRQARIATSDGALAELAQQLSVEVVVLPDSAGRLP